MNVIIAAASTPMTDFYGGCLVLAAILGFILGLFKGRR